MGAKTSIEWTDATWNPLRGCSMAKGSEMGGCLNCYAARLNARNLPGLRSPTTDKAFARILDSGPRWTGVVELIEHILLQPLKWKKPQRVFVNSMSDVFHESLADEQIDRIFAIMALCPHITFQVLTKRPERMLEYFETPDRSRWITHKVLDTVRDPADPLHWKQGMPKECKVSLPLPNVWLGVSTENQETAEARIPFLLRTPAAIRFISYEPAIGSLDLSAWVSRLDWVIAGGESGPGSRPADADWFRSLRDQCLCARVPFFFKQWGEWLNGVKVGKKKSGAALDGFEHKTFPQVA